jgi:cell wall assembly regulator SMI1
LPIVQSLDWNPTWFPSAISHHGVALGILIRPGITVAVARAILLITVVYLRGSAI